jgi:hypothetical protein
MIGNYPLLTKKNGGKIVVINLQETKNDKQADLIINNKLDFVFEILFEKYLKISLNYDKLNPKIEIRLKFDQEKDDKFLLNVNNVVIDNGYTLKTEPQMQLKYESQNEPKLEEPNIIFLFSGKRKSGKDYTCSKLVEYLNNHMNIFNIILITLASPIKEEYAAKHGLDYEKLLDSSDYKEKYRSDMIKLILILNINSK